MQVMDLNAFVSAGLGSITKTKQPTGSKFCADCGNTISANKTLCMFCAILAANEVVYVLGVGSPGGFEETARTTDKQAADSWVATPANMPGTMNVYRAVEGKG